MILERFYINAAAFAGVYLRNSNGKKVHELTRLSISPRWEKRWYGVWLPISFSRMGNVSLGTGLRIGPLVIGTNNLLPIIFKNKTTYEADLYVALKVPLFPTGKFLKKNQGGTRWKSGRLSSKIILFSETCFTMKFLMVQMFLKLNKYSLFCFVHCSVGLYSSAIIHFSRMRKAGMVCLFALLAATFGFIAFCEAHIESGIIFLP